MARPVFDLSWIFLMKSYLSAVHLEIIFNFFLSHVQTSLLSIKRSIKDRSHLTLFEAPTTNNTFSE